VYEERVGKQRELKGTFCSSVMLAVLRSACLPVAQRREASIQESAAHSNSHKNGGGYTFFIPKE